MIQEVIDRSANAQQVLEAQTTKLAELRDLERKAPEVLARLEAELPALVQRLANEGPVRERLARYPFLGEPTLMVEPGRALASNIGLLLSQVGVVKRWQGVKTWVNLDASQNHLANILSAGWYYHAVAAANAAPSEAELETVDLVGPLCTFDVMGGARRLPRAR